MSKNDKYYTIGNIASMLNITHRAIRLWEKSIPNSINPIRDPYGRRIYSDKDIKSIEQIIELKKSGLNIAAIAKILYDNSESDSKEHSPQSNRTLQSIKTRLERLKLRISPYIKSNH